MMNVDGERNQVFGPREFSEEVAARLAEISGVEKVGRGNLTLQVVWQGRTLLIELQHFYELYKRQPEQFETIVQSVIGSIRAETPEHSVASFDKVKDRIYPIFKPIDMLAELIERKLPMLVYRNFYADLIIAFAIEEGGSALYVNEEHLAAWGVKESRIYQHAIENLQRKSAHPDVCTVVGEGARRLVMCSSGDGFDAARLLVADLLEEWQAQIPGRLVLGIPNRDFLIGCSDADPEILRQVAQQIAIDSTHREYGLTDQLFTLVNGRIELYEYESSGDQL